jgi:hypothetical protein
VMAAWNLTLENYSAWQHIHVPAALPQRHPVSHSRLRRRRRRTPRHGDVLGDMLSRFLSLLLLPLVLAVGGYLIFTLRSKHAHWSNVAGTCSELAENHSIGFPMKSHGNSNRFPR